MSIGSHANAKLAYHIIEDELDEPSGWKFLDAGCTRSALLGPDGYVYKVPHPGESIYNRYEVENARKLRNSKKLAMLDVAIPQVRSYYIGKTPEGPLYVNAMEYIEPVTKTLCAYQWESENPRPCDCRYWGQPRICYGVLFERLQNMGIYDMAWFNVHYAADGKFYIIDLGV